MKSVEHLVLDTGAIIANVNLHNLAKSFYAPSDVLQELRSSKARKAFELLPFEVLLREPSKTSLKQVTDAAKKTGDYQSLSVPDMKVIALTLDLQNEFSAHPSTAQDKECDEVVCESEISDDLSLKLQIAEHDKDTSNVEESGEESTDEESSDDEGWITQDNFDQALKQLGGFEVAEELKVGCLTTDFALQNVLLYMNLGLISITGYRIRKIKTFVLRCKACFNTTSIMTKEFCPSCGNKMLHKCAVSIDENGEQKLHINWDRLANKRGLQYSIPAPRGGKYAVNEKLFEDQRMPQMQMAKARADPLADGPFAMHDVNSRSAVLGIRTMNNRQRSHRNKNESKAGGRRK